MSSAAPAPTTPRISNFKGSIGSALIDGNVTRTNTKTGQQDYFPFINANMRFMTGTFRDDGKSIPARLRLFEWTCTCPVRAAHKSTLNPSQFPPVGLFWTVPIPAGGVQVDLDNGNALMRALKVPIFDYGTLQNATSWGATRHRFPAGCRSKLSGRVEWLACPSIALIRRRASSPARSPKPPHRWSGRLRQVTSPSSRTRWKLRRV